MNLLLKTVSIYILEIIQVLKFQPLSKDRDCGLLCASMGAKHKAPSQVLL